MMKFIFMLLMLLLMCLLQKMYWIVQLVIFVSMFMFMFMSVSSLYFSNLSYIFGCDMLSYMLILLSIWISGLMFLASLKINLMNFYVNIFSLNVVMLLLLLVCTFSSMNLFMFYLFFEGSLIPILILILGWGVQPERLMAGMYLLFYTLFVSLPMLMGIFYLDQKIFSMMIYLLSNLDINFFLMYMVMLMAFLVKIPMFFVHLWLPKAHVEAPISGSMILAGIMLKLGGYGVMRVMIFLSSMNMKYGNFLITMSMVGAFYISLMCFFQIDLKSLVAYSSVAHMGIMLGGLMTVSNWGFSGAYLMMIGHGLCSSGLFCLVNFNYERLMSRSLLINKGMMSMMPILTLWWFLFLSSNMSAPPSLNLIGEISLMNSLVSWSYMMMILLMLVSFFSAGYSLYLFSHMQHGNFMSSMMSYYMGESREFLLLLLHWIPLNLLILKLDFLIFFL
uniref:NADH-ubiquinone oxidoreductase chain 4 n=1 Tax=Phryganea bipunctata TaxID=1875852 RepID=A0A7D7FJ89_9NEOP|nr:NADH dehydrogenase subunit 4 [Phryganea bipunctata]QMP96679.1 NADH dehydrogenase subunit 4 [Phryganea bipunctata]